MCDAISKEEQKLDDKPMKIKDNVKKLVHNRLI